MYNQAQQQPQQQPQVKTTPQKVTLLDGTEVTLQVAEGASLAEVVAAYTEQRAKQQGEARLKEVMSFAENIRRTPQQQPPLGSVSPGPITGIQYEATRGVPEARREFSGRTGLGTQTNPSRELLARNAAEAGVDVTTGAPIGVRTMARVAGGADPLRQMELVNFKAEEAISEAGLTLPEGMSAVFVEEYTGEPAYYRVERDADDNPYLVPTLINPPGTEGADVAAAAPAAMQMAAEVFGSGVGAAIGRIGGNKGMTLGAAVGSGTMAAAANWARQMIARSYGVPEEQVQRIKDDEMFYDVLMAAGSDLAVGGAFAIKRGITNHWLRPLDPNTDIKALQEAYYEATGKVMKLEDLLEKDLHLTLGMATGDPQQLALESQVRNTLRDFWARKNTESQIANEVTMGGAVRRLNERAWPTAGGDAYGGPSEVGRRTLDVVQAPGERAATRVEAADARLTSAGQQLPRPDPDVWVNAQVLRNQAADSFRAAEDEAWTKFRGPTGIDVDEATGVSNIWLRNAANSPIRTFMRGIGRENEQVLAVTYRKARNNLLESMNINPATAKALDTSFPSLADEALDFRQLHVLLSYLKQNAHRMEDVMPGWSRQDVNGLIGAIERQVNVSPLVRGGYEGLERLRQTPAWLKDAKLSIDDPARDAFIRDQWDKAKQATTQRHDFEALEQLRSAAELRRVPGMPGEPVQARTTEFVNQPDMVRSVFFRPNNSNALAELKHLEGFSPELRVNLQKEMLAQYRQAAFVDGKFSRTASDKFLQQFDGHIRQLFGNEGAPAITNIQTMADQLKRMEMRAEQVNDVARRTLGKQVNMADPPAEVARELLMGRYTPSQMDAFARHIQRVDPVLWDDIQQQGLRWIEQQAASGAAGKKLNVNALNKLIDGDTGRKLATLYGEEYVQNLGLLRDVYGMMANAQLGQGWATNVQTPLLQITRSLLGPLSKKQRFITAMNRAMKSMGNRQFREVMMNPEYLQRWVTTLTTEPGTYAAAHAALGLPRELFMAVDSETRQRAAILKHFQNGGGVEDIAKFGEEYFLQQVTDEGDANNDAP